MQTLLKVDALNATGQATGPVTVGGPLGPTQDPTPAMALIRQDHSMLGEEEEDSLDRQQTMLSDQDGFFDSLAQIVGKSSYWSKVPVILQEHMQTRGYQASLDFQSQFYSKEIPSRVKKVL